MHVSFVLQLIPSNFWVFFYIATIVLIMMITICNSMVSMGIWHKYQEWYLYQMPRKKPLCCYYLGQEAPGHKMVCVCVCCFVLLLLLLLLILHFERWLVRSLMTCSLLSADHEILSSDFVVIINICCLGAMKIKDSVEQMTLDLFQNCDVPEEVSVTFNPEI